MKHSIVTGFSFGLTSGVITTLGLMVGLQAGTNSKLAVIGGILTIAVADAFSDALGIHVSQESQNQHSGRAVWESTFTTFISKFIFALTFAIPVFFLPLTVAILISVFWGMLILGIFNYLIAKDQKVVPSKVVAEHLLIALVVVLLSHYLGDWIRTTFK